MPRQLLLKCIIFYCFGAVFLLTFINLDSIFALVYSIVIVLGGASELAIRAKNISLPKDNKIFGGIISLLVSLIAGIIFAYHATAGLDIHSSLNIAWLYMMFNLSLFVFFVNSVDASQSKYSTTNRRSLCDHTWQLGVILYILAICFKGNYGTDACDFQDIILVLMPFIAVMGGFDISSITVRIILEDCCACPNSLSEPAPVQALSASLKTQIETTKPGQK